MHFPKVEFLKFKKNTSDIHYPSQSGEINCVDISKDYKTMEGCLIKKKSELLYI